MSVDVGLLELLAQARAADGLIVGIDEAGRGPLAGPVTGAAVVFDIGYQNARIEDSKRLKAELRDELYQEIVQQARAWAVCSVGPRTIERINIRCASELAMRLAAFRVRRCLEGHRLTYFVDGNMPLAELSPLHSIVKGDQKVFEISAASILAKVSRDRIMVRLAQKFPGYGLDRHSGYPTKGHKEAIAKLGPSRVHRKTFSGVRQHIAW